jgi:hypothetical protein
VLNLFFQPPSENLIRYSSSTSPEDIKKWLAGPIQTSEVVGVATPAGRIDPVVSVQSGPKDTTKKASPEVGASVQWLMDDIESLVEKQAGRLFNSAFSSRGVNRKKAISELKRFASAEMLIVAAIEEFRRNGNEDRLDFASTLLLEYPKKEVLHAIAAITDRDAPEVTSFLGVLGFLDAPVSFRARLLARLHQSRNPEVLEAVQSGL